MSRAKSSLTVTAVCLAALLAGCASTDADASADAELNSAIEAALQPASPEERAAANRADPLTRANFWSKEYAKDPANVVNTLEFAASLKSIKSYERAVEVLSQCLLVNPEHPDLMMALGRAYLNANNTMAAARTFEETALLEPARAEAWAALGMALDQLDRHNDAQEVYRKALELQPDRTSTLANYGLSLALTGDLAGAEHNLRLAASQPDATVRIRENLALVLGLAGKYDEMVAISGRHAPKEVAQQNADVLKSMAMAANSQDTAEQQPGAEADSEPSEAPGLRLRRSPG